MPAGYTEGMVVARVRRTMRERGLVRGGERVLVACSGGPDSAVLLHVLHRLARELDLELCAASVNHGLRADADRDVRTAALLAERLEVPFAALRIRVAPTGASLQERARRARYDALFAEADRCGATRIAVGHTLDDQAETVLARLLRGSGVLGLSAIDPRRADGVVRPLLDCSRAEVHAYASRHELPYVLDPSNDDEAFTRSRLRKKVLPLMAAEDPRIVQHLAELADDARELRELVDRAAIALLAEAASGPRELRVEPLRDATPSVRAEALARWVEAMVGVPARRAHVIALEHAICGRGEALLPGGVRVRASGGTLTARDASNEPVRGRTSRREAE